MYDVDTRLTELADLLRASGYRLTPQRLAVVRALIVQEDHPSAETVYQRIQPSLPTTSLATVYNTLDALKEIGQVLEIRPGQGPSRWDVRRPGGHPHLLCTVCGRVEDVPNAVLPEPPAGGVTRGWTGLDARLDFQGVCPACEEGEDEGDG